MLARLDQVKATVEEAVNEAVKKTCHGHGASKESEEVETFLIMLSICCTLALTLVLLLCYFFLLPSTIK